MKLIDTKDAVGHVLCHDITQIIKGVTKDAVFRKGHVVTEADIPVLLSVGKDHLYVWEKAKPACMKTMPPKFCGVSAKTSTCTPPL